MIAARMYRAPLRPVHVIPCAYESTRHPMPYELDLTAAESCAAATDIPSSSPNLLDEITRVREDLVLGAMSAGASPSDKTR